jgi:hypothetical protein
MKVSFLSMRDRCLPWLNFLGKYEKSDGEYGDGRQEPKNIDVGKE